MIGDLMLELNFSSERFLPYFFKAFQHLESHGESVEGYQLLRVNFWEGDFTSELPWQHEERHHLGLIRSFTNERYFTLQQPGSEAVYMLDTLEGEAFYCVNQIDLIPHWESDFPLRMLLHWWLKDTPLQPIHAAAVGHEKGGLLLAGKGGSGKSTSALSCVNSSLKLAGDDYVLLDTEAHQVYSLFCLTKANEKSLDLLANLKLDKAKLPPAIDDKYRLMLYPDYEKSLIRTMPVLALLLPRLTCEATTTITPCSQGEAMLALAPTTLFQLPGLRERSFGKMTKFVKGIACFHLNLGEDIQQLPQVLNNFIQAETRKHD